MKHNGFGYDCGAALRASFVLAFLHFAEKISACLPAGRLAKRALASTLFMPVPCFK